MIVFVASYATGLGNVPWQQGELFGLEGTHRPVSVPDKLKLTLCAISFKKIQFGGLAPPSPLQLTGPATSSSGQPIFR